MCEPSAASRPSVYGLGLVVMLMVRVWYACADQVCGPAGLVWQILTGIMCSVCGQCQQGPVSLAAAGPWLSACRLVLQGLPMVANRVESGDKSEVKGVQILPCGSQSPQLSASRYGSLALRQRCGVEQGGTQVAGIPEHEYYVAEPSESCIRPMVALLAIGFFSGQVFLVLCWAGHWDPGCSWSFLVLCRADHWDPGCSAV